jgi:hypothetical protein
MYIRRFYRYVDCLRLVTTQARGDYPKRLQEPNHSSREEGDGPRGRSSHTRYHTTLPS